MKKGLLLTLVIAMVMLVSSAFSYAPVMNEIPDIVIGDIEQGATNNFFVFSDAFIFDNYVTDQDTTHTWPFMKWSFKASPLNTQVVSINGETEEPGINFENPTNLLNTSIGAKASFRNESLSPSTGTAPYPNPSVLSNIYINMFVSDGTYKVSQEVAVYTVDDGQDGYSAGIQPSWLDTFGTVGNWTVVNGVSRVTAPSSIASYDSANGRLACKFPVYPLPAVYYEWEHWSSAGHTGRHESVQYQANTIYVLRAKMSSNVANAPGFRLRVQALDNMWTACLVLGASVPNGGGGITTTPQNFYSVFQPQGSTANAFMTVDMYSALSYTGEVYIDEFAVYAVPTTGFTYSAPTSMTTFTGWEAVGTGVTIAANSITFPDPNGSWNYALEFVNLATPIQKDDVYRLTYKLSKSGTARADQSRLRVADTKNAAYGSNFVYNDSGTTTRHYTTTPQDFYLWHWAMNGRGTDVPYNTDLTVSMDTIESISGAASTVLTGVTIEKVTNFPELVIE